MQLEFDWSRRERCADRAATSLRQINVSEQMIAVVYLLLTHENAQRIDTSDPLRNVVSLRISYAAAGRWLQRNAERFQHLRHDRSNVRRAVEAWKREGICQTPPTATGTILIDFGRLMEWHAERDPDLIDFAESWPDGTTCDRAGQGGTTCNNASERKKESYMKQENTNPSFSPPPRARSQGLPTMPPRFFDLGEAVSDRHVCRAFMTWFSEHGLGEAGFRPVNVLGAILATRARMQPERERQLGPLANPESYLNSIVDRLKPEWPPVATRLLNHEVAERKQTVAR